MIKLESVRFAGTVLGAAALLMTSSARGGQIVSMSLANASSLDQTGFTANLTGVGQIIFTDDEIGIYQFTVTEPTSPVQVPNPLYSVCLAPLGDLEYGGPYNYNVDTVAQAANYSYPVSALTADGLENALYLWNKLSPGIDGPGGSQSASAGAALALAMYTAMYNSTGYGSVNAVSGPLTIANLTGATLTDYESDIAAITPTSYEDYTGNVLVPVDDTGAAPDGQEFELIGWRIPDGGMTLAMLAAGVGGLHIFGRSLRRKYATIGQ
jgi:hypothetical protein